MNITQALEQALSHMPEPQVTNFLKEMRVSHATLRNWRMGTHSPSPEHAAHIAQLAGIDPAELVIEVLEERAEDELLQSVYARLKRGLAAAMCILCKKAGKRERFTFADLLRTPTSPHLAQPLTPTSP